MGLLDFLHNNKKKEAIAKYEFPSHKRILNDSVKLIQSTKKLETLLYRYQLALNEYNWIQSQISNGVPLFFKSKEYFPEELRELANRNINRIAKETYSAYKIKSTTLKTEKSKENLKTKTKALLEEYKNSLLLSSGTSGWRSSIESFENKL